MARRSDNSVNRNSMEVSSSQMASSSMSVKSEDFEQGSPNVASEDSEMSSCIDTLQHYEPTRDMNFRPGARLEAKDLGNDVWYPVKVIEVDWEGEEILIHFEKWSARYDEWISMDSPRLRPAQRTEIQNERKIFTVGEEVMATWSDSRKYPARIKTVQEGDKYEVVFFDGFQKVIKGCRMSKLTKAQLETITDLAPSMKKEIIVEEKKPIIPVPVTPVAKPKVNIFEETYTDIGTKEGRRERKRRINVAELLQPRKRARNNESVSSPKADMEKLRKEEEEEEKVRSEESEPAADEIQDDNNIEENLSEEQESSAAEAPVEEKGGLKTNWWMKKRKRKSQQRNTSFKVKMSFCSKKVPIVEDRKQTDSKTLFAHRNRRRRRGHFLNSASNFSQQGTKKQENMKPMSTLEKSALRVTDKKTERLADTRHGERPSIELRDPNLPSGWSKWGSQRKHGTSAGKWDVFLVGPDGRKFRTHSEIRNYCTENKAPFSKTVFNFSMGKRKYTKSHRSADSVEESPKKPQDKQSSVTSLPPATTAAAAGPANIEQPAAQRRIKTLLPKVRSSNSTEKQLTDQSPPALSYASDSVKSVGSDGEVIVGGLKIQMDNSMFVCPKEGCLKHFRKESLLQMHLKHYHPEYNKYVSSTPNVADLAYARTVGENVDDIIPKTRYPPTPEKNVRFETPKRVRTVSPIAATETFFDRRKSITKEKVASTSGKRAGKNVNATDAWPVPEEPSVPAVATTAEPSVSISTNTNIQEKPQPLVEEKPEPPPAITPTTTTIKTLLPVAVSPSKALDISLEDRLRSLENKEETSLDITVPQTQDEAMSIKSQRSSSVRKRNSSSASFADLSPVKKRRSTALEGASVPKSETVVLRGDVRPAASYRCSKRRASLYPQVSVERLDIKVDSNETQKKKPEVDVVQKKVDLRKQELINCICGIIEEDGLMIQCDICLCWQHGVCNNIEKESDVPEKYICYICQNPFRGRASRKYIHDQEYLKDGKHPSLSFRSKNFAAIAQRESILKRSHDMTSTLLQLQQVLHSLRAKLSIAQKSDHPKLYLWAKRWEKAHKLENSSQLESDKKHIGITSFTEPGNIGVKQFEMDSLKSSLLNSVGGLNSSDHFGALDVLKENILNHPVNLDGNVNLSNLDLLKGSILEHSNEEEMVEDNLQLHQKILSESGSNLNDNVNLDTLNNKSILCDDKGCLKESNKSVAAVNNDTSLTDENVNENTIEMIPSSDLNTSKTGSDSIQDKNEPIENKCDTVVDFQRKTAYSQDLSNEEECFISQEHKNSNNMLVEKNVAESPLDSNLPNDNASTNNSDINEPVSLLSNSDVLIDKSVIDKNIVNETVSLSSNSDVLNENDVLDTNIMKEAISLPSDSDVLKDNAVRNTNSRETISLPSGSEDDVTDANVINEAVSQLSDSDVFKNNSTADINIINETISLPSGSDVPKDNVVIDTNINETILQPSNLDVPRDNDIANAKDITEPVSSSDTVKHINNDHELNNVEETEVTEAIENANLTNVLEEPSDVVKEISISEKISIQDTHLDAISYQPQSSPVDVDKHIRTTCVEEVQINSATVDRKSNDLKGECTDMSGNIDKKIDVKNKDLPDKKDEMDMTNMKEILADTDEKPEISLSDAKNLDIMKHGYDGDEQLNEDDFGNKLYAAKCDPTDTLLQHALISEGDINIGHGFDHSLQLPICQNELIQFATTMAHRLNAAEQEQQHQQVTRIPQPEAPIDPKECQISLLEHLKHYQNMIEMRLSALETQVSALEAEDPDMINDEPADFYPRTKQTVIMLQRDLKTMQQLAGAKH